MDLSEWANSSEYDADADVDNDVDDGSGGSTSALWGKDDASYYGSVTANFSKFSIPAHIGTTFAETDRRDTGGLRVSGRFQGPDGDLLPGVVQVISAGEVLHERTTNGDVRAVLPPPTTVLLGESLTESPERKVVYDPTIAGVPYTDDFDGFVYDFGDVSYGLAIGEIVDHNDEPVPGIGVQAPGMGTNTGNDGMFELYEPEGEQVPIVTLQGTLEASLGFTPDPDRDNPQTFAFPALSIEVVDASYAPIEGAPVAVNGETYYTDESGTVSVAPVPLGEYHLEVMGEYEATVKLDEQGTDYFFQFGPNTTVVDWEPDPAEGLGGIEMTAIDDSSGVQIRGIAATIPEQGIVSESNEQGVVKLLAAEIDDDEPVTVQIGSGDMRYDPTSIEIEEMPDGEMVDVDVRLSRKDQVVNF